MTIDWSEVGARLRRLATEPMPARPVFGTGSHRFGLEPPLSAAEVAAVEHQFGVALPEEYRDFLLQVGAGGAGPAYGAVALRHGRAGWTWADSEAAITRLDQLHRPFAVQPAPPPGYDDLLASEPAEDAFAAHDLYYDAYQKWANTCARILREDPTRDIGAACLSTVGCAQYTWLVVSGPAAGQMWQDARCDDFEMAPETNDAGDVLTFGTWYLDWLAKAEAVHLANPPNRHEDRP